MGPPRVLGVWSADGILCGVDRGGGDSAKLRSYLLSQKGCGVFGVGGLTDLG